MDMKKTVCAAVALLALGASAAAFDATERDIVRKAVSAARERLRTASALDGKAVTLLPVKGDDDSGFAGQLLMTALVEAGKTCVISNDEKNDERFKRILQEIKWDERQTTLKSIDPATADELGRLKSTQILLEARFDIVRRGRKQRPVAELGLLAYSVATKQFVWAADVAADAGGRKWPDPSAVSVKVRRGLRLRWVLRCAMPWRPGATASMRRAPPTWRWSSRLSARPSTKLAAGSSLTALPRRAWPLSPATASSISRSFPPAGPGDSARRRPTPRFPPLCPRTSWPGLTLRLRRGHSSQNIPTSRTRSATDAAEAHTSGKFAIQ